MKLFSASSHRPHGAAGRIAGAYLFAGVVLAAAAAAVLLNDGLPRLNAPSQSQYPVRGVDVSAYQGDVDWKALARQGVSFAFIKATEGSGSQDPNFQQN